MGRLLTGNDVFNESVDRLVALYEGGHRVVLSFSAGKDSGICLELMVLAASIADRLPVDVVMRDEEIMFPGTYEYAERVANRPEVNFHWLVANQPIINVFNRKNPYWWTFDPLLPPEAWVRTPPDFAEYIPEKYIQAISTARRFPPPEGKMLVSVTGLRVQESMMRMYSIHASNGHMAKGESKFAAGAHHMLCRPIYDWRDGDVWKAIRDNGWDYNAAYNTMHRYGVPRARMRIGPPTMNGASASTLKMAQQAWPQWFDKVATRLPGVRTVAQFGKRAIEPERRKGETWKATFDRECVEKAPPWIAERAQAAAAWWVRVHGIHSTYPLPDVEPCVNCTADIGSWKSLTKAMYLGDPFCLKVRKGIKVVEPEFFREGSGTWGSGTPSW